MRLETRIGNLRLKNPLIAAAGEHLIEAAGVRRAVAAGAGAVVVKSANETAAAKEQLQRAEYLALDAHWNPVPWDRHAPPDVTLATRSGLTPQPFESWLDQTAELSRWARAHDCTIVASLILADLERACGMARAVEAAGVSVLEFNIGTPYASQAAKGAVSTELDPARVTTIVRAVCAAVTIPVWIKVTGQSERVPDLAAAAFDAGAASVVMAGRLLGMIPDLETLAPMLSTSLGVGGFWNLPLTCHWLALSRTRIGREHPLIGINGCRNGSDMARLMLAGASAVGMASEIMLRGWQVIPDALAELDGYLARKSLSAAELIGRAADARKSFADMPLVPDNWRRYVPEG